MRGPHAASSAGVPFDFYHRAFKLLQFLMHLALTKFSDSPVFFFFLNAIFGNTEFFFHLKSKSGNAISIAHFSEDSGTRLAGGCMAVMAIGFTNWKLLSW